MVLSHTVNLTNLQPGITYHFRTRSIDSAGNRFNARLDLYHIAGRELWIPSAVGHAKARQRRKETVNPTLRARLDRTGILPHANLTD
jgi:hypothetical protein